MGAVALGWSAGRALLLGRGPQAVRRFDWAASGEWHLERADGRREPASLSDATVTLGPWILLVWVVAGPRWRLTRLRYALIDVREVGQTSFRALKGRLFITARLTRQRDCPPAGTADT
jgi:hypothetical protein